MSTEATEGAPVEEFRKVLFPGNRLAPRKFKIGRGQQRRNIRVGIRIALRRNPNMAADQREALERAMDDNDALDLIVDEMRQRQPELADGVDEGKRDWKGFFEAIANFIVTILPVVIDAVKLIVGMFA